MRDAAVLRAFVVLECRFGRCFRFKVLVVVVVVVVIGVKRVSVVQQ